MPPMPTPALIVRQEGNNAHTHPFVSVYEAYKKSGPNVLGVEALQGDDGSTGVKVNTADVYAAIYMQHGVWYYSATGPVRVKIGKETKKLNEGYNQKL